MLMVNMMASDTWEKSNAVQTFYLSILGLQLSPPLSRLSEATNAFLLLTNKCFGIQRTQHLTSTQLCSCL